MWAGLWPGYKHEAWGGRVRNSAQAGVWAGSGRGEGGVEAKPQAGVMGRKLA